MKRYPAVEGRFYPNSKATVFLSFSKMEKEIHPLDLPGRKKNTIGAILPHAGHIYSAYQTIPFFSYLKRNNIFPETFIILHPNHTGTGSKIALDGNSEWINCIGEIQIDSDMNSLLPYPLDSSAHINEHSAEVIIPFLQYYCSDHPYRILPVCMKQITTREAIELAKNLYSAVKETGRDVLVIASSDFSHFLAPEEGRMLDDMVLDKIEKKDINSLKKTVEIRHITVCGYCPIMTLMAYADLVDPSYKTTILARGHSGEVRPSNEVVDYISILFHSSQ